MTSRSGKRLNEFEHCLARPDTIIGSVVTTDQYVWIYDDSAAEDVENEDGEVVKSSTASGAIVWKLIPYNPGLTHIFTEVMSNAIDNKWRSEEFNESESLPLQTYIKFTFDTDPDSPTFGTISVENDGYYIPVEKQEYEFTDHRSGKKTTDLLYPAEVFFGDMLAGTNFDDDKTRKTSGKNGMGAKATNVMSKKFTVEHTDICTKKKFYQEYTNNAKNRTDPVITSYKSKKPYTKITFLPDYKRFDNYPFLDDNLFCVLKKKVYDCAMITGLSVYLNGERISTTKLDLSKYARLHFPDSKEHKMVSFKGKDGSECVVVEGDLPDSFSQHESVKHESFVNGNLTKDGGIHVDAWRDLIFSHLVKTLNARSSGKGSRGGKVSKVSKNAKIIPKVAAKGLYPFFCLFVRSEVSSPQFENNTKRHLNSYIDEDKKIVKSINVTGSDAAFTKKLKGEIEKMTKWNFVSIIDSFLSASENNKLESKGATTKQRKKFSPKLTDANFAGTKQSGNCVLHLTEGQSAKKFVLSYISLLPRGSDFHGVYPIKGKFINTTEQSERRKALQNREVTEIMDILNIRYGVDYSDEANWNKVRYKKGVCIDTDADDDGIHIRALLITFFRSMFKGLVERGFLGSLSTAVVVVTTGKGASTSKLIFYSNPSFKKWYESQEKKPGTNAIKYYKGLGTHGPGDCKMYRKDPRLVKYTVNNKDAVDKMITLGLTNTNGDARKAWITRGLRPSDINSVDGDSERAEKEFVTQGNYDLTNFIDEQLIIFHRMSLIRAIPKLSDGFKESQGKAFFGIASNVAARSRSVDLEKLSGAVKEKTGYHHGIESLHGAIKKMAMGFVGSNNIPFFVNDGNFGSRDMGGKDAAAARYISTRLEQITLSIFHPLDEPILKVKVEDGDEVEYENYEPVIPIVLVNGADGIGSGFLSSIPCYNPEDIVDRVKTWITDPSSRGVICYDNPLTPWYRGFTGEIKLEVDETTGKPLRWESRGVVKKVDASTYEISELPIGVWNESVNEKLAEMWVGTKAEGKKAAKKPTLAKKPHWHGTDNTVLWKIVPAPGFTPSVESMKFLKTTGKFTNIVVLDKYNCPVRYESAEALLQDFCSHRLTVYEERKKYWTDHTKKELVKENSRYKFVQAVVDGKLKLNQDDEKLEKDMEEMGLKKVGGEEKDENETAMSKKGKKGYEYLLSMAVRSLTKKKMEELKKLIGDLKKKLKWFKETTAEKMWLDDLAAFEKAYEKFLTTRVEEEEDDSKKKAPVKKRAVAVTKKK